MRQLRNTSITRPAVHSQKNHQGPFAKCSQVFRIFLLDSSPTTKPNCCSVASVHWLAKSGWLDAPTRRSVLHSHWSYAGAPQSALHPAGPPAFFQPRARIGVQGQKLIRSRPELSQRSLSRSHDLLGPGRDVLRAAIPQRLLTSLQSPNFQDPSKFRSLIQMA